MDTKLYDKPSLSHSINEFLMVEFNVDWKVAAPVSSGIILLFEEALWDKRQSKLNKNENGIHSNRLPGQ